MMFRTAPVFHQCLGPPGHPERDLSVPELTIIACPTCGLPAELLTSFDPHPSTGVLRELLVRCLDDHVSTIQLSGNGSASVPDPVPELTAPPAVAEHVPSPDVVPIRHPSLLSLAADAVRARGRMIFWFAFGALAAALFRQSPVAALVLLPLAVPIAGLVSARRSWASMRSAQQASVVTPLQRPAVEDEQAA